MEIPKEVGVGIIIGFIIMIAFAIHKYVSTTKERKERKITEKKNREEAAKKDDIFSKKENLRNLKEKGILTELEYQDKVSKVENSEIQIEVERTEEYEQLKSLLNSGVLTKEEFESKLEVLKKKIKVEIDTFSGFEKMGYTQIGEFIEGLAKVWDKDQNYGFINKKRGLVIPTKYEFAEDFSEGLTVVRLNGKFGYIDKGGKVVISLIYDAASSFKKEEAKVSIGKKNYLIDKKGKRVAE